MNEITTIERFLKACSFDVASLLAITSRRRCTRIASLMFDQSNVIWLGDFNYRSGLLTSAEARGLAGGDDFPSLLQFDQLTASVSNGNAFQGFTEAPITFKPTYKYDMYVF
jgi:hypothetical protein